MMIRFALAIGLSLLAACHDASARQFRVLYSFCAQTNCTDGQVPLSGLIADSEGNLYGTAVWGGSLGGGVVFELARKNGSWVYQVLYNFCSQEGCADGVEPAARLIIDTNGNLFGTARGIPYTPYYYPSTLFELSPDANHTHWTFTTLKKFCLQTRQGDGCHHRSDHATSALTYAGQALGKPYDGKSPLYGYGESSYNDGSSYRDFVYRYSPNGGVVHILETCALSQSCPGGSGLRGDPLLGDNGSLYGTMNSSGRYGQGVAFTLDVTTAAETVLHDFCSLPQCSDGNFPSGLMLDAAGNLYGSALGGSPTSYCLDEGFTSCGIVFRLAPQNGQYTYSILRDLCEKPNCSDGIQPQSSLIRDAGGILYGAAALGGGNAGDTGWGGGTVFEVDGNMGRALHKFCSETNCADGEYPIGPMLTDAKGNLYGTTSDGGANFNLPNVHGGTIFEITN